MIQKFNKKSDFQLILDIRSVKLGEVLRSAYDCNNNTLLWYSLNDSNNTKTILGYSSVPFSNSNLGIVFTDSTIEEIEKEFSYAANIIKQFINYNKDKFKIKIY